MSVAVHCLVVPLPCATGDDGQPMRLLPRGRLTAAILPIVGRATGATSGGDDLGGGILGKLGCEGHGQTIHRKNKSAMPKIILAIRRQCRHITRMSNTTTETAEVIQTAFWTPNASAKQRGAKDQVLFVYPDRQSFQRDSGYVVVSKQYNSRHVFSVLFSELSKID